MLSIKPSILKKAERTAKQEGFTSVSEYVEDLIERDVEYDMPNSFSTKEELEALILEALNDPEPAQPLTKQDFEDLRNEIRSLSR
jgi:hypothetical protein